MSLESLCGDQSGTKENGAERRETRLYHGEISPNWGEQSNLFKDHIIVRKTLRNLKAT